MKNRASSNDILQRLAARPDDEQSGGDAPPNFQFEVIRAFQEGEHLFLQIRQHASDEIDWVTMSLLNLDPEGHARIVHQITNRNVPRVNPDLTRVGGTMTLNEDADAEATRVAVTGFVQSVFLGVNPQASIEWLSVERFQSYNPYIEPGFLGFVRFLDAEMKRPDALRYICISDILVRGDFAAVFSVIDFRGAEYRACDLFRVEDGKIVEHWDIAEQADNQTPPGNDRSFMPL